MRFEKFTVKAQEALQAAQKAAVASAQAAGLEPPTLLAVTVLTSWDQRRLTAELAIEEPIGSYVPRLAGLAVAAGLGGCVCSPHEVAALRAAQSRDKASSYFELTKPQGKLWPGVWQRTAKGTVKNVLTFGQLPNLSQRWPVEQVAQQSIAKNWPVNLSKWVDVALKK